MRVSEEQPILRKRTGKKTQRVDQVFTQKQCTRNSALMEKEKNRRICVDAETVARRERAVELVDRFSVGRDWTGGCHWR